MKHRLRSGFLCALMAVAMLAPGWLAHGASSHVDWATSAPMTTFWQPDSVYAGPIPPLFYAFDLGSIGVVYRGGGGDGAVMAIYGIDEQSEGHLLLFISQAEVDAVQPFGLVTATADQSLAVVVWPDRNITIAMGGPTNEGKVHYVTLEGGLDGPTIEFRNELGEAPGSAFGSPSGTLTELQLGTGVGADDCVATPQSSFSRATTSSIYVSAMARNTPPGVNLQSIWSFSGDERVRFDYSPDFQISENCIWFFIDTSDTEFTPGDWRVDLTLNGALQGAVNFAITP